MPSSIAAAAAARELDTLCAPGTAKVISQNIVDGLTKKGTETYYFHTFSEIETFLEKKCLHGDLLITMGAGDVVKIGINIFGKAWGMEKSGVMRCGKNNKIHIPNVSKNNCN